MNLNGLENVRASKSVSSVNRVNDQSQFHFTKLNSMPNKINTSLQLGHLKMSRLSFLFNSTKKVSIYYKDRLRTFVYLLTFHSKPNKINKTNSNNKTSC